MTALPVAPIDAGALCVVAALIVLSISRHPKPVVA
jgi:hypothetical protein